MKHILWPGLVLFSFAFAPCCPAQSVFYRVLGGSNCEITAFNRNGTVTWTNNASGTSEYQLQWAFSLRNFLTGTPETVAYGPITGTTISLSLPMISTPRPSELAARLIPSGPFLMGNNYTNLSRPTEIPVHEVQVDVFYLDRYEVSGDLWNEVRNWALTNGYTDLAGGSALETNHPIQGVTWYDCVKWCNARSEKEHLRPVYFTDAALTNVYRTGELDLQASNMLLRMNGIGYRLPTEAEWEKSARGGLSGHFYPWPSDGLAWSNHIDITMANYQNSGDPYETPDPPFDLETTPVGYYNGNQVISGVVQNVVMTNGYGLYDMAGNVIEWCWDWYGTNYYSDYPTNAWPVNPVGPTNGTQRALRGGSCGTSAGALRCAHRAGSAPDVTNNTYGFRCVRGL